METTSAAPAATWFLNAQDPDSDAPDQIPVQPPFRVGRREGCELSLECHNVSGLHAEILEVEGQLWLHDLNSTNGTFVNGERIRSRASLRNNDTIQFGSLAYKITTTASNGRQVCATIAAPSAEEVPQSPEEKLQVLLDGGVVPFFQPIFDITDGIERRIGYEVLGRSRMFGLRTAGEMFAAAKDLKKETELSCVLRFRGIEAAEAAVPTDRMLFLNTHPSELVYGGLEESMHEIREAFPSRSIVLELPESILKAPDDVAGLRSVLQELDIKLAIYDFGAGHIRLSELSEMAPDIVKFDGALIQGINKATTKRQQLITAMTLMVNELGITPMAEFIESAGEHDALNQLGIHYAQGYHYGRPMDIAAVSDIEREAAVKPIVREPSVASIDKMLELADAVDQPTKSKQPGTRNPLNVVRDTKWLLDQPADHYTIQVMMVNSIDKAYEFIAAQPEPGDYVVYRKPGRSSEWHLVVFSTFADRAAAQEKSEAFENTNLSTWVRSLSIIHKEIRMVAQLESLYSSES